ncbi:MAG TPA: FAD-dependent oxidoreductase, partial [Candidatus Eisenbacteria bacterium]|nr:FAD-dependent oxidoreductase [Candidatus Eisenbacteria bacterium]
IGRAYAVRDHMLRFGAAPFHQAGVDVRYPARAVLTGERELDVDGERIEAGAVLLAAGLDPVVPPVPGLREAGFLDNEGVLSLAELPRRLAVIGSGPIGCEFAQIFARFGVRVTVVELLDRLLPSEEPESGQALRDAFEAEGIAVLLSARLTRVERAGSGRRLQFAEGPSLEVDELLVAVGRSLDGAALGLDAAGIAWTPKGIQVDDHLRTTRPWAWAAGDVIGGALFTHVASELGRTAAANALLGAGLVADLRVLPRVTFTDPEVASVGLTERQAREIGREVRVGLAAVADAEKAQIDGQTHGHVKVVADAGTGELLGCHIVAATAGDMIHEAVAIMAGRVPIGVVARTMHAYPTLSELMRTALGQAAG